jgi:hypothetical protein
MPVQKRREFPQSVQVQIIARATVGSRVHCENPKCGAWIKNKKWEIDHIIAEGLVIDKAKKLTAADGQLLCISCHDAKTPGDTSAIAEAVRREARDMGARKPGKKEIDHPPKPKREPYQPAAGVPEIMRRYL